MKERGIIFTNEMVRALLSGQKTQMRLPVMPQPLNSRVGMVNAAYCGSPHTWLAEGAVSEYTGNGGTAPEWRCPYGKVGDRIWVRETWATLGNEDGCYVDWNDNLVKSDKKNAARIYRASCEQRPGDYGLWSIPDDADWKPHTENLKFEGAWRPPLHMPRWASRILLEITAVRVERVNSISEEDAKAEGIEPIRGGYWKHYQPNEWTQFQLSARGSFATLWNFIYGDGSFQANPWVWVTEFKRIEGGAV